MRSNIIGVVAFSAVLSLLCGCLHSSAPTSPEAAGETSRTAQLFLPANITEIFGTEDEPEDAAYCDVDSSALILHGSDTPATYGGRHWTAFVSVRRDEEDEHLFRPVYRWISDGPLASCVSTVEADLPTQGDRSCRFVKCSAKAYSDGEVRLAVCYQILNAQDPPVWDLGVTILTWDSGVSFTTNPPSDDEDVNTFNTPTREERWPDIAWDPFGDDCYVVFSCSDPAIPGTDIRLFYRRYDGSDWGIAWGVDTEAEYNADMPRIDIGRLDLLGGANTVAIAYTAQFCDLLTEEPHVGFHVHVIYWDESVADGPKTPGDGNTHRVCLRNPCGEGGNGTYLDPGNTYYLDAGMPCIDIAPSVNDEHHGVIAFAQVVGNDQYGPIVEVWQCNTVMLWFSDVTDAQAGWADGLYPSIAYHYGEDFANLTYFRQEPESDRYHPWVAEVNMTTGALVPLTSLYVGDAVNYIVTGDYNPVEVQILNPGAATAITATVNNAYWAAWCDRSAMEPPPEYVEAGWGWPGG